MKRSEEKNLTNSDSGKKDSREEVVNEREETKRRILQEDPVVIKGE
ncbi:MAG: hypothetical protein JO297_14295 [Nitrososphaeraceae archaeon]|nr:hypothetical protein [Nitrososphaeraceae archaeon]